MVYSLHYVYSSFLYIISTKYTSSYFKIAWIADNWKSTQDGSLWQVLIVLNYDRIVFIYLYKPKTVHIEEQSNKHTYKIGCNSLVLILVSQCMRFTPLLAAWSTFIWRDQKKLSQNLYKIHIKILQTLH